MGGQKLAVSSIEITLCAFMIYLESTWPSVLTLLHFGCSPKVSGEVDQSAGMLSEEVRAKGYALLCVSEPQSDCRIKVIDEASLFLRAQDCLELQSIPITKNIPD